MCMVSSPKGSPLGPDTPRPRRAWHGISLQRSPGSDGGYLCIPRAAKAKISAAPLPVQDERIIPVFRGCAGSMRIGHSLAAICDSESWCRFLVAEVDESLMGLHRLLLFCSRNLEHFKSFRQYGPKNSGHAVTAFGTDRAALCR